MKFTRDMYLKDIMDLPEMTHVQRYFVGIDNPDMKIWREMTIEQLEQTYGWKADPILYGLQRLYAIQVERGKCLYQVYSPKEVEQNPQKADVVIIDFPAIKEDPDKPYVLVIAGGAYVNVYSYLEGFPGAAKFNEMGYHAFVLNYRTGKEEGGLLPKPMDDTAQAVRYIREHAAQFGVRKNAYIVNGYSAGGHLAASWGGKQHGYAAYGLPRPKALLLAYPYINTRLALAFLPQTEPERTKKLQEEEWFLDTMFGKEQEEALYDSYAVDTNADGDYPPTYLVCNRDDPAVSCMHSISLRKKLEELGIPVQLEMGEKGGHGFGLGNDSELHNWLERAAEFEQKL